MPRRLSSVVILAASLIFGASGVLAQTIDQQLTQLLLSSPWCAFKYNKTTGYSSSQRVQFFRDGTFSYGSQGEGYSSGAGGSFASQHNGGNTGYWKVANAMLLLSDGSAPLQPIDYDVRLNSSGHPIIIANGMEYSACR